MATARYLADQHGLERWWAQAVTIQYEYDRGLRKPLTVPAALRRALARAPRTKAAFAKLSLSHRREHVQWVVDAKQPDTRVRRIQQTLVKLTSPPRARR